MAADDTAKDRNGVRTAVVVCFVIGCAVSTCYSFPKWQRAQRIADEQSLYLLLISDFAQRVDQEPVRLPFEDGESLRRSVVAWKYRQKRHDADHFVVFVRDGRPADAPAWSFIFDCDRHWYWASYYPGFTTTEIYRESAAVYGPYPWPSRE